VTQPRPVAASRVLTRLSAIRNEIALATCKNTFLTVSNSNGYVPCSVSPMLQIFYRRQV
jgi:hypothetical protein